MNKSFLNKKVVHNFLWRTNPNNSIPKKSTYLYVPATFTQ